MAHETSSKNIDGITDLVVVAPIKEGFIPAYENVTYATRLKIVAEALNRVRISVREHEEIMPFEDVTERIQSLLDFRIGIVDKDLFALAGKPSKPGKSATGLASRRFLYLTATFDGAWEPYMRQIWDPMGPFLDLLFCNCEDYVTAAEHSFEQYAQWVRDNQMDSAIFYATTGLTIRDHLYLNRLEQIQRGRSAAVADRAISRLTMPRPDRAAKAERDKALADIKPPKPNFDQLLKIHELALEALTVLYRLADYYPPEWLAKQKGLSEGHYLIRAAREMLSGWKDLLKNTPQPILKLIEADYKDPLGWFTTGLEELARIDAIAENQRPKDPRLDRSEVQGGVLRSQGSSNVQMRQGVLLMFTITDAAAARLYLGQLETHNEIDFDAGAGAAPDEGFFRTIAFTADGLERLGLTKDELDWFPKEFRDGMEMRSGLFGDMRQNHPRNWTLPLRNWPKLAPDAGDFAKARPPIEMSEIDIVLQVRTADTHSAEMEKEIARIAGAAAPGMSLLGYQLMQAEYDSAGMLVDYFKFSDGISQPRPVAQFSIPKKRDEVPLGEILLGYRNDRSDFAPIAFPGEDPKNWRMKARKRSLAFQFNGSFLVIRKLEQHVDTFEQFLENESARINLRHPKLKTRMTPDRLKARMLGRGAEGTPPIPQGPEGRNDFDYEKDPTGVACPFASHIRRANPREPFLKRNAPRLMRRGMSFDNSGTRGLMFMAYNASIAEQFETIQRWINGGNSTYVASGHMDPIIGVPPKTGKQVKVDRMFRFVEGKEVIRVTMPKPFVALHWGLYLFVPSRSTLRQLSQLTGTIQPIGEMYENRGRDQLDRLERIQNDGEMGNEWKRLLEDFDAKDPSERDITAHVWAAIRWYKGGSIRIGGGIPLNKFLSMLPKAVLSFFPSRASSWDKPPPAKQPVVLSASYRHVMQVLSDWKTFTTEEQLRRIEPSQIPIFVTQQPDNKYRKKSLRGRFHYRKESEDTNAILMRYGEVVDSPTAIGRDEPYSMR